MTYRKTFEIIGWVDESDLYCDECFTGSRKDATPIFLGDEYDPSTGDICAHCLQYLDGHEADETFETDTEEEGT